MRFCGCLFLKSLAISGSICDDWIQRSGFILKWFWYLVLVVVLAKNPVSHKYVVAKGRSIVTAF